MTYNPTDNPTPGRHPETWVKGNVFHLDLWYPRFPENIGVVEIGIQDTRAADNIRISYDYDRDGWKIEQASVFEWDAADTVMDEGWEEVVFVPAWGRLLEPSSRSSGSE